MKHLLYYSLENDFKNDQIAVGGDGNNVVSVVDGVAWCRNTENAFYRYSNKDEDIVTYTVTVYYKDEMGEPLASSDIFSVPVYSGKSANLFITPKSVENYEPDETGMTLSVSSNTEYTFTFSYLDPRREIPLTFEITSGGYIRWKAHSSEFRKTIEYKKNDGEWISITSNTMSSAPSISVVSGDIVQFRGDNVTYGSGIDTNYNNFSGTTCRFKVKGNIMSLIDSTDFATIKTLQSSHTFYTFFEFCTGLTDSSDLILPAKTLLPNCYSYMFQGCSSLTTAPELLATTLAYRCYDSMFFRCTSLTTAPELPATTLQTYCYQSMFSGCTSLTTAPSILPATTLARYCYYAMFSGCTSLTTAPSSIGTSATTLANYCCSNMFSNCTSLTTAPELPATILAEGCYYRMFRYCTGLTSAPSSIGTSATTLANYCCSNMFSNCTSLTTAPELPATTLAYQCYEYMFFGCTSLTTAPSILPATTLASSCYTAMFSGCTSLTTAPELPATTLANSCYQNMFAACTSLTTAPELPATTLERYCYAYMFNGCTILNYIKCLATNISVLNCTQNWVQHVSSAGTFVKNPNMSSWTTGTSGIPSNWTVQDAS